MKLFMIDGAYIKAFPKLKMPVSVLERGFVKH